MVVAMAALPLGMVGCGGSGGGSKPTVITAAQTAGVAGSWGGTWSEGADASTFAVEIDCAGNLTGTLTPSGGGSAETVTGTVTTWNATTGAFQATLTRAGESHTLTGVVKGSDLTGSFTTDVGTTGNFVVTLSGSALVCTAQQIADLSSGSSVTADLVAAVDTEATTCNGTGAVPYGGSVTASATQTATDNVALLLKPNADGGVDVVMTFAPTEKTPQVAFIGTSPDTGTELRFTAVGTTSGTNYLATFDTTLIINGDGTLQGTFVGNVDADGDSILTGTNDCTAISGTFTGGALTP